MEKINLGQAFLNWIAVLTIPFWIVPWFLWRSIANRDFGWMLGKGRVV